MHTACVVDQCKKCEALASVIPITVFTVGFGVVLPARAEMSSSFGAPLSLMKNSVADTDGQSFCQGINL